MALDDLAWCFRTLETDPGAGLVEIKRNYRDLMNIWHPDRFQDQPRLRERCERKVKQLNDAYRRLETAARRGEALGTAIAQVSTEFSPGGSEPLEPNLRPTQFRGKWGYADDWGRLLIGAAFDAAAPFSEGLAAVARNGLHGYIDTRGRMVIPERFATAGPFREGLAPVEVGGKFGYINPSGELAVRPRFEAAQPFSEGLAGVKFNGQFGFIRKDGGWAIPPAYAEVQPFENGRAYVRLPEGWVQVGRSGEVFRRY